MVVGNQKSVTPREVRVITDAVVPKPSRCAVIKFKCVESNHISWGHGKGESTIKDRDPFDFEVVPSVPLQGSLHERESALIHNFGATCVKSDESSGNYVLSTWRVRIAV